MQRYDDALIHYNDALKIREKTLGEKHPDTIVTLHNIAELHIAKGYKEHIPLTMPEKI